MEIICTYQHTQDRHRRFPYLDYRLHPICRVSESRFPELSPSPEVGVVKYAVSFIQCVITKGNCWSDAVVDSAYPSKPDCREYVIEIPLSLGTSPSKRIIKGDSQHACR